MDKTILESMERIIEYMYKDEEEDFNDHPDEQDIHIFSDIKRVADFIEKQSSL